MNQNPVPFDENAIGASLTLSVNDSTVQTSATVDAHRLARSLYGQTEGASFVEFYCYSPNLYNAVITVAPPIIPAGSPLTPVVTVGIITLAASLTGYVGQDAYGWGLAADGTVWNNGAVVATLSSGYALSQYVGMTLDLVNGILTFTVNGTVIGSITGLAAGAYYYAATVSGNAGDLAIWANASQTPPRFPSGALGWFHVNQGINPLYLATIPYVCAAADATPNRVYYRAIDRANSPMSLPRCVNFWPWGQSMPTQLNKGSQAQILINDPQEMYGELLSLDIRDQIVNVSVVYQGQAYSTAQAILTMVIDHCEQTSDQTKTLYLNDKLILLQSQLYRALFAPDAAPAIAGLPRPLSSGICRTYTPPMYDTTNFYLGCADEPITAVGTWRSQGVAMAIGIDFTALSDQDSFSLAVAPPGKITAETTTFGGVFDPTLADLLNGDGLFGSTVNDGGGQTALSSTSLAVGTGSKSFNVGAFASFAHACPITATSSGSGATMKGTVSSYSGSTLVITVSATTGSGTHGDWVITGGVNQPHNWIGVGGYAGMAPMTSVFQVDGSSPNEFVRQAQVADGVFSLQHQTLTIAPGESVAYEVVVKTAPYYGNAVDATGAPIVVSPAILCFGGIPAQRLQFYTWAQQSVPTAGAYRGFFTNTTSQTLPLVFGFLCNPMIQGTGGISSYLDLTSIVLVQLPSLLQNVVLQGPGLDTMLRDLLITHGPLELADYDPTNAQAIDAATGYYYGLHVSQTDTPQVSACAKLVLDSACCDLFVNRSGLAAAIQLTAPEDATSVAGALTVTDFDGYLEPWPDNAENLTSRIAGCPQPDPYTASDFSTVAQTSVPQVVRQLLMQKFQWTVTANPVMSPKYQYALNAQPLPSQFDRQADGQAEISRVCALYESPRNFYVGTVFTRGRVIEIGDVWNVTYPLATLAAGQQLLVVGTQDSPTEQTTVVTFWGL